MFFNNTLFFKRINKIISDIFTYKPINKILKAFGMEILLINHLIGMEIFSN